MLETKCVGDKYEMLVASHNSFVIHIKYRLPTSHSVTSHIMLTYGNITNLQKNAIIIIFLSPTAENDHQDYVTNEIISPPFVTI